MRICEEIITASITNGRLACLKVSLRLLAKLPRYSSSSSAYFHITRNEVQSGVKWESKNQRLDLSDSALDAAKLK